MTPTGRLPHPPALADAGVEHRGFIARVGADDQHRIGLLDAFDGRVEDVAGAAERRIECGAVLAAIGILRAERSHQQLERVDFLDGGEIAGDSADLFGCRLRHRVLDRGEGLGPAGGNQLAVLAHIGAVEALRAQAVPDEAGLVGNPLLVHRLVDARQDAHHFAAPAIDADRRADRIHHVDGFGLGQLPRPRLEGEGLRGQRADRAKVDDIALQLRGHRLFEIGGDLGILATADQAKLGNAGNFRGEADAARAVDAAVHHRLDQRSDIFVFDRALVLMIARGIDAEGHRLVLQVAFAALVADRAIQRMVDQQELHHAFPGLLDHRRVGEDFRRLAIRARAQVAHVHGAGSLRLGRPALHLDQAHAAIAGDRQPLMEAEARHFRASVFRRLQQRVVVGYSDLFPVDLELCHSPQTPAEFPQSLFPDAVETTSGTSFTS
jgi:hypothetical protein